MVTLYTLPACPICKMIKAKFAAKNILFNEASFEEIAGKLNTDRAPVMEISNGKTEAAFLQSPSDMVAWINAQE